MSGEEFKVNISVPAVDYKVQEEFAKQAAAIDWTPLLKYNPHVIDCQCGASYLSHSKMVFNAAGAAIITKLSCPSCNKSVGNARAARDTGREEQVIG